MEYFEQAPAKDLKRSVLNYWMFHIGEEASFPIAHETLPEPTFSLCHIQIPYFSGVRLLGPHTQGFKSEIGGPSIFMGIRVQPWVRLSDFYDSAEALLNKTGDVPPAMNARFGEMLIHVSNQRTRQSLDQLNGIVRQILSTTRIEHEPLVEHVDQLIQEWGIETKVKDLLSAIPLSERQVQKRFKSFTGMSIKQYLDILRLRRATTALYQQRSTTSGAILEQGYFDQSHYLNTFKAKMSQSSSSFQEYIAGIKTRLVEE